MYVHYTYTELGWWRDFYKNNCYTCYACSVHAAVHACMFHVLAYLFGNAESEIHELMMNMSTFLLQMIKIVCYVNQPLLVRTDTLFGSIDWVMKVKGEQDAKFRSMVFCSLKFLGSHICMFPFLEVSFLHTWSFAYPGVPIPIPIPELEVPLFILVMLCSTDSSNLCVSDRNWYYTHTSVHLNAVEEFFEPYKFWSIVATWLSVVLLLWWRRSFDLNLILGVRLLPFNHESLELVQLGCLTGYYMY